MVDALLPLHQAAPTVASPPTVLGRRQTFALVAAPHRRRRPRSGQVAEFAPRPGLRAVAPGDVIVRQGDPSDAMYVVLAGRVSVLRAEQPLLPAQPVAELGVGAVFGELGPMLHATRSATIRALVPTRVLEVPHRWLGALMQRHEALTRVLASSLEERSALAPDEVEALIGAYGAVYEPDEGDLASRAAADRSPEPGPREVPPPEFDPGTEYLQALTCAVCGVCFHAVRLRPSQDRPAGVESDLHQTYDNGHSCYDYELWTCPACGYSAFPQDFDDLTDAARDRAPAVVETVRRTWLGGTTDFNSGERTLELRARALELARALYADRGAGAGRAAAIEHRLAWCARERGDHETERTWLTRALDSYARFYEESRGLDPKTEIRVLYLCGELALRLGDYRGAVARFSQLVMHDAIKTVPVWESMARARWEEANHAQTPQSMI